MAKSKKLYTVSKEVLKRYDVSKKNVLRIEAVGSYDLAYVTVDLNDELVQTGRAFSCEQAYPLRDRFGRADKRLAQRLEEEFKRFCILTLVKSGVPHAPPGAVDMYWHFFILHTEGYLEFCKEVWGDVKGDPKYRHHYPSTNETRKGMLAAYKATRELYVDGFGEPRTFKLKGVPDVADALAPRAIWTEASDTSGDSYSGTIEPQAYIAR
jgi:hypothetical protein